MEGGRSTWLLRNQTPARVRLKDVDKALELAPLQTVRVVDDPAQSAAAVAAKQRKAVAWEEEPARAARERYTALLTGVALLSAVAAPVLLFREDVLWALCVVTVVVVCGIAVLRLNRRDGVDNLEFGRAVGLRIVHGVLLVSILVIAVALPLTALYFGSDMAQYVQWARSGPDELGEPDWFSLKQLVGQTLLFVLMVLLTLLPALLYFQFDRERVETLLDRWLHHIFRFDPSLRDLDDVDARYGRRLEEVYGTTVGTVARPPRHRGRSRSPVAFATLLIAVGWVMVLVNTSSPDFFGDPILDGSDPFLDGSDPFLDGSDPLILGSEASDNSPDVQRTVETPIAFAFLGAYFYSLNLVLRGYVRGDLRPKTYAAISVRIVLSLVVAWLLTALLSSRDDDGVFETSSLALGLAFLAGVVPDTVLRYVLDATAASSPLRLLRRHDARTTNAFDDNWPLTDLAGIDLYERTRLAEEGITNVQALAHSDVADLTLSTRIPFERVVHWVDQAVLYEHVSKDDRTLLRAHGIGEATSLVRAWSRERAALAQILGAARAKVVLTALDRAEWLPQLLAWRAWEGESPRATRNFGPVAAGDASQTIDLTASARIPVPWPGGSDNGLTVPTVRRGH